MLSLACWLWDTAISEDISHAWEIKSKKKPGCELEMLSVTRWAQDKCGQPRLVMVSSGDVGPGFSLQGQRPQEHTDLFTLK